MKSKQGQFRNFYIIPHAKIEEFHEKSAFRAYLHGTRLFIYNKMASGFGFKILTWF